MQEYAPESQIAIYKHNLAIVDQQLQDVRDQEARKKIEHLKEDLSKKIQDLQEQLTESNE